MLNKTLSLVAVLAVGLAAGIAHAMGVDTSAVGVAANAVVTGTSHWLSQPDVAIGLAGVGAAGITKYIQKGDILTLTPAAAVASGVGYLFGTGLFGVATNDVASGAAGEFITEGVVEIGKTSALAISVGDRLFWDATNKVVNKTSTAQQCVGIAVEAAANPSSTVKMKLGAYVPSAT